MNGAVPTTIIVAGLALAGYALVMTALNRRMTVPLLAAVGVLEILVLVLVGLIVAKLAGGVAVTRRPYRLLDAQDRPHPRRFAFGVPTESVHWVTAAGIRPGVNSVILGDADAIARSCLGIAAQHRRPLLLADHRGDHLTERSA